MLNDQSSLPTKTRDTGKLNSVGTTALGMVWNTDIRRIDMAQVAETGSTASPLLCSSHTSANTGGLWTPMQSLASESIGSPIAQHNACMLDEEWSNDLSYLVGDAPLLPLLYNEEIVCNTDYQDARPARPYRLPPCLSPDILRGLQPRATAPMESSSGPGIFTGASDAAFPDPSFMLQALRPLDRAPCALLLATKAPPCLPLLDTSNVTERRTFAWRTALAMRQSEAERILLESPFQ
jgi:hypothetical protein